MGGAAILETLLLDKKVDVHIFDPDETTIIKFKELFSLGNKAKVGRIENLPFPDDSFDVVICSEILEHLDDTSLNLGLSECSRVIRKGGLFWGTVPDRENVEASVVFCPRCEMKFHPLGHRRSFSIIVLQQILGKYFIDIDVREKLFIYEKKLSLRRKFFINLKKCHLALGGRSSGSNFFFLAKKPI